MTTDQDHLIDPPVSVLNSIANDTRDSVIESVTMAFVSVSLRPNPGEAFADYFKRVASRFVVGICVIWILEGTRGGSD